MNLKRYAIAFLVVTIVFDLIRFALLKFVSFDLGSAGSGIVPFIGAAAFTMQNHVRETHSIPDNKTLWAFAFRAAFVGMAVSMVYAVVVGMVVPAMRLPFGDTTFVAILLASLIFISLAGAVVNRIFFGLSGKAEMGRLRRENKV